MKWKFSMDRANFGNEIGVLQSENTLQGITSVTCRPGQAIIHWLCHKVSNVNVDALRVMPGEIVNILECRSLTLIRWGLLKVVFSGGVEGQFDSHLYFQKN